MGNGTPRWASRKSDGRQGIVMGNGHHGETMECCGKGDYCGRTRDHREGTDDHHGGTVGHCDEIVEYFDGTVENCDLTVVHCYGMWESLW